MQITISRLIWHNNCQQLESVLVGFVGGVKTNTPFTECIKKCCLKPSHDDKQEEGKVKSTLERELKRPRNRWEGNACSRTGPRRVQGAASSPTCSRHPRGSIVRRGCSRPCTLGDEGRQVSKGEVLRVYHVLWFVVQNW